MILIADRLILCGTCGARIGLEKTEVPQESRVITILKDREVVHAFQGETDLVFYCNSRCRDKAKV